MKRVFLYVYSYSDTLRFNAKIYGSIPHTLDKISKVWYTMGVDLHLEFNHDVKDFCRAVGKRYDNSPNGNRILFHIATLPSIEGFVPNFRQRLGTFFCQFTQWEFVFQTKLSPNYSPFADIMHIVTTRL